MAYRAGVYKTITHRHPVSGSYIHKGVPGKTAFVLECGHAVVGYTSSKTAATRLRCDICTREQAALARQAKASAVVQKAVRRTGKQNPTLTDLIGEYGTESVLEALIEWEKKARKS